MCASFAAAVLAFAGCKEKSSSAPVATTGGAVPATDSQAPAATTPTAGSAGLFVDESKISDLDRAKVEAWPRLDSFLPQAARRYGTWMGISGKAGGADFEIKKPGATYGTLVPALYPSTSGKGVSLGLFDPVDLANKGAPKVAHEELVELRVHLDKEGGRGQNDHAGGDAVDPSKLKLVIEAGGKTIELSGPELLAIPRENAPDDDSGEHKGWSLAAILAAKKIAMPKRAILTGDEVNLNLEPQDLDPAAAVPFIKLNRQGSLRFRVYKKQGNAWTVGADLRGLQGVKVLQ